MSNKGGFRRQVTHDNFVTEKYDVIKNNLLGSYDNGGNYFIAPQIVQELLELKKVKKSSFGNSIFCVGSLLGYGELVFELLFNSKTRNGKSADATLYLLEDVDKINGYLQNTLKTKLEDFNDEVENFIEETYNHFNISRTDDDEDDDAEVLERKLSDDLDNEDSFIIAKKQYSLMLEKLMEEKYLDAYGKYFTARISTLTKLNNEFSNTVLDSFNRQYALIQNVFLKEKNYMMLNELLDKCFEEYSGTNDLFTNQEQEYNNMIQPSFDKFVENANSINEKFEHKALNMLDKDDRAKVEEILDEHQEHLNQEESFESQQSVEQIIHDIPQNTYTTTKESEEELTEQQTSELEETEQIQEQEESKDNHFIQDILDRKNNDNTIELSNDSDQNFYSAFKENHQANNLLESKVLDTSKSEQIEAPNHKEQVAVSSLKDRITRLEKFKEPQAMGENSEEKIELDQKVESENIPEKVDYKEEKSKSVYDVLTREKAKKGEQFNLKSRKSREEIDQIPQLNESEESKEEFMGFIQKEREDSFKRDTLDNKNPHELHDLEM